MDIGLSILDFLIVTIDGPNLNNQMELFKLKVIDSSRELLIELSNKKEAMVRSLDQTLGQ